MPENLRIGYQGVRGSYSHEASINVFPESQTRGYKSFVEAFKATEAKQVDYAVIPVENSSAGRVMEVYNILPDSQLSIVGEYLLPIHHCLMIPRKAFRGVPPHGMVGQDQIIAWKQSPLTEQERENAFKDIKQVQSHPQALNQCLRYLAQKIPNAIKKDGGDTAGSAREIVTRQDCEIAAIASKNAAEIYDLEILEENIEDIQDNTTRFLVLSRAPLSGEALQAATMTTILFETGHQPGALLNALQVFKDHDVTLTKLETYMSGAVRENPTFYVDVGAGVQDERMEKALKSFEKVVKSIHIMGSYPASKTRGKSNGFLPVG